MSDYVHRQWSLIIGYPMHGPVSFALDIGDGFNSVEEIFVLGRLLDVCVNEEGVSF
jgi:hypothetical protein